MVTIWFDPSQVSTSAVIQLDSGAGMSGLTLDAALRDRVGRKVTLTKHPIEQGVKPSDHAELEPRVYTVEGIITGTPIAEADQDARGLSEDTPLDGSYAKATLDFLDALIDSRQPLTITTDMRHLENMVLTNLDDDRDSSTGEGVHFNATFEEVRFVQTQAVRLQPPAAKDKTKITGEDKQGKKVARQATDQEVSWGKGFLNALTATDDGDGVSLPPVAQGP